MQRLITKILTAGRIAGRYLLVWLADTASVVLAAIVVPGIYFTREADFWYLNPFVVALFFGLLNALVRPVLVILLLPLTVATLGLVTLALNAALFYLIPLVVDTFVIQGFAAALAGVLVLTLVNTLLGSLLRLGDEYSFIDVLMKQFTAFTRPKTVDLEDHGIAIVQIDGLSYKALKKAIQAGHMPFVGSLIKRRHYSIREWFSGLPSQTSAVQSGLFYGSAYDIPGFRWYNKTDQRLVTSSSASDMREVDERIGAGHTSILQTGSCILSLVHGNAMKKMLTVSSLTDKDLKQHRGELEDFAIFSIHPYMYTRTILFMLWDFIVDRFESLFDMFRRKGSKIIRSVRFSIHRAVGNALMREITTFFMREDILRGMPIIYANYLGYDMVAHYAGPRSRDAMSVLTGIDRRIKRIHRTIRKTAKKHYDLIIISDHGQTDCVSFETMFGKPLHSVIEDQLENRRVRSRAPQAELGYFSALLRDMRHVEEAYGTRGIRGGRRTLERIHARMVESDSESGAEEIVVCPSGCLAHVYFAETPERLTAPLLIDKYPNLIEYLISHAGIGFILLKGADGDPLMMSKSGMRKLRSGEIEGTDPMLAFANGDMQILLDALLDLSTFPSSGDLILNGSLLEDGRVISFEKQVGTHGGVGGDQTRPFILYPGRFRRSDDRVGTPAELHDFFLNMLPK